MRCIQNQFSVIQKKRKRRKKQINPYMKTGEQGNELTTPDLFCVVLFWNLTCLHRYYFTYS